MLAARTGLSPVMVGRSAPLSRLVPLLQGRHADGLAAVALVTGEAGVGKTRLVQELMRALPPRGVVLAGGAEPGSLGRPYDVVRAMLDGTAPAGTDDVGRAVLDTITGRIGERAALVVFEDLHWADAESVAVFEALATSPLPATLVVATCRQEELTLRLPAGEMLERLERRHFVHHVHLERLGRAEVGAFLASVHGKVPPSGLIDTLHGRTGGNPFFLEEILNVAGDVDPADLDRQPLPWSLAELVRGQLDGLSADERRLVQAAAVLARRAEFDLLAEVTGTSEDELIRVLRGLLDRGLLMEECEDSFTFRHALVRDAVEQQLLGRERRRLHEAALEALRRSPCEDLAALAHHARGAGRYDEFVALARQGAASYLAGGSSHQALRLAADALAEEPDDTELLAVAARAAWLLGLYDEALAHVHQWHRVVRSGSPGERAAAARLRARVLHETDRVDEMWSAVAELERLVDELPPGEDRALTMAWLAQLHMVRLRSRDAVAWAERAIVEADAVGAKGVRAQALVERASAIGELPGRYAEAGEALREAVVEAEAVGDWVLVARAINNLTTYVPLGSPEGRALLGRLQEVNERAGFDGMGAHHQLRLAEFAIVDGDLAEARRLLDAMPPTGGAHLQAAARVLAGVVAVEEGRIDAAAAAVVAARPDNRPHDQATFLSLALVVASHQADALEVGPVPRGRARPHAEPGVPHRSRCDHRPARGAGAGRTGGRGAGDGGGLARAGAPRLLRRRRRGPRRCPGGSPRRRRGDAGRGPGRRRAAHRRLPAGPAAGGAGPLPRGPRPARRGRRRPAGRPRGPGPMAGVAARRDRRPPPAPRRHAVAGDGRGRPHGARARGGGAAGRGRHQRRAGPAAVHLAEDGGGARVQHPDEAGHGQPGGGGGVGGAHRLGSWSKGCRAALVMWLTGATRERRWSS